MLLLPVDEGYAFDYLAVLYVKRDGGLAVEPDIERVEALLRVQVPHLHSVLASAAFKRLANANAQTFDAIELAHRNNISAREVQRINHLRFQAKRALQHKFWPATPVTERKTKL